VRVIHAFGDPSAPVPRLLRALEARGHEIPRTAGAAKRDHSTLLLASGTKLDPMALGVLLGAWRSAPGARILVLSRLGVHPDARAKSLRELWNLEELARASGLPVLTIRLGPLVGPSSPLWIKLRRGPWIPRSGRMLLNPLAEPDAIEAIDRVLKGHVPWEGVWELAGPEAITLAELASLAQSLGPFVSSERGSWEPPLTEMLDHRLAEGGRTFEAFGIEPRPIAALAKEWA
jgi:uncharacterized protein YbjT (DUF2867 family)